MPLSTDFFLFFTLFYIEAIFSFFGQSFYTIFKGRLISGRRKKNRKYFTNYSIPPPSILTFVVRKIALQKKTLLPPCVCARQSHHNVQALPTRSRFPLSHTSSNTNSQLIVKRTHFSIIQHDQHTKHIRTLRTVPMKLTGNKTERAARSRKCKFLPSDMCTHTRFAAEHLHFSACFLFPLLSLRILFLARIFRLTASRCQNCDGRGF